MKPIQPPKYTSLLPSRWGWFLGLTRDTFQTGSIFMQGEWAPVESELLGSIIPEGGTVIDVGANVGGLTLAFAAFVGETGAVLSFEPQRYPFMCLCANLALNSLMHRCQAIQAAAGAHHGEIDCPILDPNVVDNFGGASLLDKHTFPTEKVQVIPIDAIPLTACQLIKADVEGMEPDVLMGARQTIKRFQPALWVECLDTRDTLARLIDIFKEHNYRAWKLRTSLYVANNIKHCKYNGYVMPNGEQMKDDNILAVPAAAGPPPCIAWLDNLSDMEITK